jgi:hypothetical protein
MTLGKVQLGRPRFDPSISLGAVLIFLGGSAVVPFLVWLVQSNNGQDNRITALETSVSGIVKRLEDADRRAMAVYDDVRTGQRRLDDKISALLIQGYRGHAPGSDRP